MVSFSCENCGDVLTKKKLDPHRNRCRGATFTCIDCMVHFPGLQYRSHTSCMTEDQKYQGALYKDKSKKQNNNNPNASYQNQNQHQNQHQNQYQNQNQNRNTNATNHNKNPKVNNANTNPNDQDMAYNAYVEDANDQEYDWAEFEDDDSSDDDNESPMEPPPEAPTPPSANPEEHVDVFDFLVATGQTPNASTVNLPHDSPMPEAEPSTSLVRYERREEEEEFFDPASYMEDDEPLVEYGSAPVLVTPAPKYERRKSKESDSKKDKKRKRLHVDVPGDEVMTDAPPVLHSGLTGGLTRMMRPVFPPSPDYSGGDVPEVSPASPMKKSKSKHSKHSKHSSLGHSIFGLIAGSTKTKTKSSKSKKRKTSNKSSSKDEKSPKLIEYRPHSKDGKTETGGEGQVILFKPRADVFLSFIDKGPESDRGCSMNKVLKRFHRERQASSDHGVKSVEEKELWRSLRVRQNDRGEIVLFTV